MKKRDKYFLIVMIFLIIMIIVLSYFYSRYNNTILLNDSKKLLADIYELESGKYELRNGKLYNVKNELVYNKEFINASGFIIKDKYMNVKFKLNKDNNCISKTSLGNIKFENNNCSDFKEISVKIIKNNNNISFETNELLEYKISKKDDFKGLWVKQDYNKNIIIKSFNEGKNYIWFKDIYGNISKTYSFNIDCLNTSDAMYDSSVFYCSGSTIILDDIKWIVIKDNNSNIELMKYLPLDDKFEFSKEINDFKWSTSNINNYLNYEFIKKLSTNTIEKIKTIDICDNYKDINCNGEICGGRSREEIEMNNYYCDVYTNSMVKLISYDEFNYAYINSTNKDVFKGYYWSINSLEGGFASSILYNLDYYILENINNKLDVKPVIIINK